MDTTKNNISSQAMLSAVSGLMFFGPLVKRSVENDQSLTQEEKNYIMWYIHVWFVNLTFLVIVLLSEFINFFWIQPYLSWIINIWSIAIFIISIFSIVANANSLSMRNPDEKLIYNVQNKGQVLKSFTPVLNFSLRFRQNDYSKPYRWLKESILLWTCFIFWTLLLWNSVWLWILVIIFVRLILLLLNVDIIPLSMKRAVNNSFLCNLWEIFAYIFAPVVSKIKKIDYETVLQTRKAQYTQWQKFWISIVLQYLLFFGILYLIHRNITISMNEIVLFIAAFLWLIRVVLFSVHKKTVLRIPVLAEIVSLIFK